MIFAIGFGGATTLSTGPRRGKAPGGVLTGRYTDPARGSDEKCPVASKRENRGPARMCKVIHHDRTDADLIGLVNSGDESAFSVLFRRHESAVYGLALSIVRSVADGHGLSPLPKQSPRKYAIRPPSRENSTAGPNTRPRR